MSPPRRKSSAFGIDAVEERKRGQRLFGALLGTLSQTSAKPAHKRRDQIDKKQQEKLRQKDEDLAAETRKKREELDAVRREQQKLWEEQSMLIRHRNMLATAHFLKTKTKPYLYYKPWELRTEEEEQIKRQISEVENTNRLELARHAASKGAETGINGVPPSILKSEVATGAEHAIETPADLKMEEADESRPGEAGGTNDGATDHDHDMTEVGNGEHDMNGAAKLSENAASPQEEDKEKTTREEEDQQKHHHDDHGGEELVEGQEDDVIY